MKFNLLNSEINIKEKADIRKLYIELTTHCNFDCEMCFRQSFREKFGSMKYELFQKILNDMKEFPDLRWVVLGGIGEPMVYKHFKDAVIELKNRGYRIIITSNGSLINDSMMDFLISAEVDKINISAEDSKIGHPFFKKTLELIKTFNNKVKDAGREYPKIGVEYALGKESIKRIEDTTKEIIEAGVSDIIFTNIVPTTKKVCDSTLYNKRKYENFDLYLNKLIVAQIYAIISKFKPRIERHCDFIENNATVIRWDGEVSPCYRLLHNYTEIVFGKEKRVEAHSFGNVKNQSLYDIWNSKDYMIFRFEVKNSLFPSCTDCEFRDSCFFINSTEEDCWGNSPTCADCLWWHRIAICS